MPKFKSTDQPGSSEDARSDDLRADWERPTLVRLMASNALMGGPNDSGSPEPGDSDS